MSYNLWIENPPPFRQAMRGEGETLAEIPMEEGEEIIKLFTDPEINFAGFRHADLDRFEYGEKASLWKLLDPENKIGLSLTDNYAMEPAAAVSGWYFTHPQSRYFNVGKIQLDQVRDYAERKDLSLSDAERWLAPNLAYDI